MCHHFQTHTTWRCQNPFDLRKFVHTKSYYYGDRALFCFGKILWQKLNLHFDKQRCYVHFQTSCETQVYSDHFALPIRQIYYYFCFKWSLHNAVSFCEEIPVGEIMHFEWKWHLKLVLLKKLSVV